MKHRISMVFLLIRYIKEVHFVNSMNLKLLNHQLTSFLLNYKFNIINALNRQNYSWGS